MEKREKNEHIFWVNIVDGFAVSAYQKAIPIFDLNNQVINFFVIAGSIINSFFITNILRIVFKRIYQFFANER